MRLLKFSSLDEYRAIQIKANKQKFKNVFADDAELHSIAEDFLRRGTHGRFGLCHGVRNGYEVRFLQSELPALDIVGTDISDTAAEIPGCVVWDMHEVKPEWKGKVDFLYSNSWDHSYDPVLLFSRWSESLSDRGLMYIPYTDRHSEDGVTEESKYDSFGCSLDELITIAQRTLVLDDIMEIIPRFSGKILKNRLSYLRAGRFSHIFREPLVSRRVVILVLRKRDSAVQS
jgi:hypothetical protein